ncbi:flagellar motor switch protein FliN [Thiorhodococcus drewsii AZ1]|uniref:Flagellar motor switch protein FliN n=1 Tax=Thiorhodococcus drewsii AZ1 TaxID=765913 RepID=G2E341_9GAMM|nr:flagellar motor switch protein FliN [Thiorhodococcus drewsii]EGV30503.1 flagellar motor switch protein FliN [Thiorhodococcus drewsii AZ1]
MTSESDMGADQDPNEAIADDWAAALQEQQDNSDDDGTSSDLSAHGVAAAESSARGGFASASAEALQAQPMSPEDFSGWQPGDPQSEVNLNMILDVPVTIAMEIGRTKISIRNLLQLNQGSVVELDRLAGEPLDVLVNGTLIAHGEVVVVNEKFGIRLTDVISPSERVRKLR